LDLILPLFTVLEVVGFLAPASLSKLMFKPYAVDLNTLIHRTGN